MPSTLSSTPATLSSTPATRSSTPATLLSIATTVFATPLTLSSTVCVAFKFSATAIRASSCVNLSNLRSASSISFRPISLFPYFSEHSSVNGLHTRTKLLTKFAFFNLLRRNPKNRQNFDHNLNDCIHHFRGRPHRCVDLETSEKAFNALKDIDERILASSNILSCL
jgi:hypothetical protein